jgi:hypothetical protein
MRKPVSPLSLLLLLSFTRWSEAEPIYDFESPDAAILSGRSEGSLIVGGIPLQVRAGLLDATGLFTTGGAGAILSVIPPGSIAVEPAAGGLGVDSTIDPAAALPQALTCTPLSPSQCTDAEGLQFVIDPRFVPDTFTLRTFGDVTGLRVFAGPADTGLPRAPVSSGIGTAGSGSDVELRLYPGITSLSLGAASGTAPAVFVASLAGKIGVPLDIDPRSCPNSVRNKGMVHAAILGTDYFDVSQVDPASVRLVGVAARRSKLRDVATVSLPLIGKASESDCTAAGKDGFLDLGLVFNGREVIDAIEASWEEDVHDGDVLIVTVEGNLFDGNSFVGEDVIVIRRK